MFDIGWSELLILGIVVLVFVGPKELPVFMRTLGKYAGVVRRHANEFKGQFDAAMQEAELESVRREVENLQATVNAEVMRSGKAFDGLANGVPSDAPSPRIGANPSAVEKPIWNSSQSGASVADATTASLIGDELMPPMPAPPGGGR